MVDGNKKWKKGHFGTRVSTPHGPVAVTKTRIFNLQYVDYTVIARVFTTRSAARRLIGSLNVETVDKSSDVLKLSLTCDNHELSLDVLNALIVAYNSRPPAPTMPSMPTHRRALATKTMHRTQVCS